MVRLWKIFWCVWVWSCQLIGDNFSFVLSWFGVWFLNFFVQWMLIKIESKQVRKVSTDFLKWCALPYHFICFVAWRVHFLTGQLFEHSYGRRKVLICGDSHSLFSFSPEFSKSLSFAVLLNKAALSSSSVHFYPCSSKHCCNSLLINLRPSILYFKTLLTTHPRLAFCPRDLVIFTNARVASFTIDYQWSQSKTYHSPSL